MDSSSIAAHVSASLDAVIIVGSEGKILVANSAAHELFGYPDQDLIGADVELLVPLDKRSLHQAQRSDYSRAPRGRMLGGAHRHDNVATLAGRRRDGSVFPAEISLSPEGEGAELTVMCVVRDVSDRSARDIQSQRIRQSLDAVDEAVLLFDADTLAFSYVNSGACRQTGYSEAEFLNGMTPLSIKPQFDVTSFAALLDPLRTGERSVLTFETRHRRKDGSELPVEVLLQIVGPEASGEGLQMMAMVRDITARKEHHQRLVDSERAFRSAFEHAPVGMALTDLSSPNERVIISANEALGEMLGYSSSELEGRSFESLTHPDDQSENSAAAAALVSGSNQIYRTEKRYRHADGRDVWAILSAVRLDGASAPRALAHIVDVSRRVLVEAESRDQRSRLERAADRERIARELQDRVIQRLFAVGMSLQASMDSPDRLVSAAEAAVDELDASIAVVRDSIFRLGSTPSP